MELRNESNSSYCRPTTLYPLKPGDGSFYSSDPLQPEREPIKFEVNLVGAPPEVEQLVNNIKHVAEQFLYHWKTFPISKFLLLLFTLIVRRVWLCSNYSIMYLNLSI